MRRPTKFDEISIDSKTSKKEISSNFVAFSENLYLKPTCT